MHVPCLKPWKTGLNPVHYECLQTLNHITIQCDVKIWHFFVCLCFISLFFSIVVLIGLLTNGLFKISILPAMYKVWFYILKDP